MQYTSLNDSLTKSRIGPSELLLWENATGAANISLQRSKCVKSSSQCSPIWACRGLVQPFRVGRFQRSRANRFTNMKPVPFEWRTTTVNRNVGHSSSQRPARIGEYSNFWYYRAVGSWASSCVTSGFELSSKRAAATSSRISCVSHCADHGSGKNSSTIQDEE